MTSIEYFTIGGSWIFYLAIHSLLAANPVKDYFFQSLGTSTRAYRLFYSTISTGGLLGLMYLMAISTSNLLFSPHGYLRYGAMILSYYGVILVVTSFRFVSVKSFLGLKKSSFSGLCREGLHGYVRHPIYSGTILVFLGMFLYYPTDLILLTVAINLIYLPFGIYWEEQKLIAEFGEAYERYRNEVPAIFPSLIRSKPTDHPD
ncbi:MAG: isoprenylcysteine carboxylmethyltransferase family protein [Cyclobacteriaceae bacterium]